ncbi:hypothetical protein ABMA27_003766 [Loxostege sticticalis]|uniref:Uncharacterized protein n=1 Tax=Loxostege sticticalis TaxID=481309 RepID=A0ABR3HQ74_LOXSC
MKCETKCPTVPIIRKCCFCVPIRKGVIIFAYINMVLTLLSLPPMTFDLVEQVTAGKSVFDQYMIELTLTVAFLMVDVVMLSVLIIGAHKKKRALLKIFFYVGSAILALSIGTDIIYFDYREYAANTIYFFLLCLDVYLMFLVYNLIRVVEESLEVQYVAYQQGNQLAL